MRRLLFLVLLAACGDLTAPDALPVDPLPTYRAWWAEVEQCTDLRADMSRIAWFHVDACFDPGDGECHYGMWLAPHTIYLALPDVEWLVKHEMLHDLTNGAGHDHPLFLECDIAVQYLTGG